MVDTLSDRRCTTVSRYVTGITRPDGNEVRFHLEGDGEPVYLQVATGDLGAIITNVIGLGILADAQRAEPEDPAPKKLSTTALQPKSIHLAEAADGSHLVLAFDVGPTTLAFRVSKQQLGSLREALADIEHRPPRNQLS